MPLRTNRTERKRLSTDFKATAQSSQRVPVIRGFFTLRFAKPEHEEEFLIEHFRALFPLHMIIMLIAAIAIWACVAAQCKPSPSPALRVSMFPGSAVRLAVHFFLTPKMGFRVHHRVHVVMSTLPFLARNVQAFRAHLGYQGGPSDGFDLDFHELSRIGVTGQVTAMAFFPIFMYLHPTAFLPRMWLIANFAVCQSFSHARTREDTVAGLLMVTIGVVLGQILELHMRRMHQARLEIEAAAEDARRADSRLNHLLKNKSAEANYLIESVTDRLCAMSGDHVMDALLDDLAKVCKCAQRKSARPIPFPSHPLPSLLANTQVQFIHEQTVDWTHMRELFLQLQKGLYKTAMPPTDLQRLLRRVMGSEAEIHLADPCPYVLHVDGAVLQLQLEEARSNALKYREPLVPIRVTAQLIQTSADLPPSLHVALDNCNRTGLKALSTEECAAAFERGQKGSAVAGGGIGPSTGLGLDSVAVAARAVGGTCWLSTRLDFETQRVHTIFNTQLPAHVAAIEDIQLVSSLARPRDRFSGNAYGGSTTGTTCQSSGASSCGASSSSNDGSFIRRHVRPQMHPSLLGRRPLCYGLDDSETLQMLLESIFTKLGAHPDSRALGSTDEEQDSFCDLACGHYDGRRPADIVVIDTQLSLAEGRPTGIDIAKRMREERGFDGLIAIHSGLSPDELRAVESLPFVDLVVSKGYSANRLAAELLAAWSAKIEKDESDPSGDEKDADEPRVSFNDEGASGSHSVLARAAVRNRQREAAGSPSPSDLAAKQQLTQEEEELSGLRLRRWANTAEAPPSSGEE